MVLIGINVVTIIVVNSQVEVVSTISVQVVVGVQASLIVVEELAERVEVGLLVLVLVEGLCGSLSPLGILS